MSNTMTNANAAMGLKWCVVVVRLFAAVLVALFVVGCITPEDKQRYRNQELAAVERYKKACDGDLFYKMDEHGGVMLFYSFRCIPKGSYVVIED